MSSSLAGASALRKLTRARSLRVVCLLCAALFATGLAGAALAEASPQLLTLPVALRAAQERSYALAAEDAAARAAREMAVAAERLPDPMLALSVDNLPIEGDMRYSLTDDFMTMRSLGVTQTFTREGKRLARAAVFEREVDTALAAHAMQLTYLQRDTALAWFDCYYQQQMVELLAKQRDEAVLQIEAAEAAYRAGRGSQADFFLAQSSVARIGDRIRDAEARRDNATIMLARWVGDIADLTLGVPPLITQTHLAEHALKHQLEQHPDIALLAAKEAEALADAEVARQEKRVDWSLSLMVSQRGPAYSDMVSLGVSVPLQWDQANRQDREVSARLAKVEQALAEREEMTREHLAEAQRWLTTWRSNLARLADFDATLIPLATRHTSATLAAYRGGRGDLASVLEARRMEIDTRIERLGIEMETAALWVALEYLIPGEKSSAVVSAAPGFTVSNTLEQQP